MSRLDSGHITKIPFKLISKTVAFSTIPMNMCLRFDMVKATEGMKKYFLIYSPIVAVRRLGFTL